MKSNPSDANKHDPTHQKIGGLLELSREHSTEQKLNRLNRLYAVISQVNQAIVRIQDRDELFRIICKVMIDFGQFRMAWIGIVDVETGILQPFCHAGHEEGYLSVIKPITIRDTPEGRGPSGSAIREGRYYVCPDFNTNPLVKPWREEALKRGYQSSIAFPIKLSGQVIGAFSLYATQPNYFDNEEIALLDEVAGDINFALDALELKRKHEEAVLQLTRQEEKYRLLFEHMPSGYVLFEILFDEYGKPFDHRLLEANSEFERQTGLKREQEIGLTSAELSFKWPAEIAQRYYQVAVDGESFHYERYNESLHRHYFIWVSSPAKGQLAMMFNDLSDIRAAEAETMRIRMYFQTLFKETPLGMAIVDTSTGKLLEVNANFAHITGWTEDQLLTHNWMSMTHPDDVQIGRDENARLIRREIQGFKLTKRYLKPDGSTIWVNFTVAAIQFDGDKTIRHLSMIEDITERKANEDWIKVLSNVVEQSPLLILITDHYLNITYVNRQFTQFTQYTLEDLQGKRPWVFNPAHWEPEVHQNMWDTLNAGMVWKAESANRKKDHTPFWEHVTVFPLFNGHRTPSHYIIIKEEITDKKRLYDDLVASKEKAEESDRLKSAFLANLGHEVRTPLNSIIGFSTFLTDPSFSNDEKAAFIQIIQQNGDNLIHIINDLLDISQIEAGQLTVNRDQFVANDLITSLYNEYLRRCQEKDIQLHLDCDLPNIYVNNDASRTRQILNNLLSNALKFTSCGSIRLSLHTAENVVQFQVADTGIGIAPEFQEIIFERFRQVDLSYTRKYGGNGLGLAISRQLAELMGGSIALDSEPGKGSTFTLSLPL